MPLSVRGKPYYTMEQVEKAKACSALAYAMAQRYHLIPQGPGRYQLREHDSMIFLDDGRWYWNSRHRGGRALDFMLIYEGRTMLEAVLTLTNDPAVTSGPGPVNYHAPPAPTLPVQPFTLPKRADTAKQLFAYLCGTRRLDRELTLSLVRQGVIYQSQLDREGQTIYNVVFLGVDEQGIPRNAIQRGLTTQSRFKNSVAGSDKTWPFLMPGKPDADTLAVFESPIDAISHATVAKAAGEDWRQITRMALCGNFPLDAVTKYLDTHPGIQTIALGFDNDEAGQLLRSYLTHGLADRPIRFLDITPATSKDWNDLLCKGVIKCS